MAILAAPSSSSDPIILKGLGNDLVVAGYASVEMVDKQGDLITRSALKDAFGKFMKADGFRNVQLAHSNIQVGTVIPSYTDSSGRMWKSEVDDTGMFVVIKLRGDIEKAREVASAKGTCARSLSVVKHLSASTRATKPAETTAKFVAWNSMRSRFARRVSTPKRSFVSSRKTMVRI